jgi:hypothetical protein
VTAAGWKTVGEIREASDATLLSLQYLGKGSVVHLRETLGLSSKAGVRPHGPKAKGKWWWERCISRRDLLFSDRIRAKPAAQSRQ